MSKKVKYTYQVETVDAKKARQFLTKVHPRQAGRDFKKLIQSYAEEMRRGTWDVSVAQTISFDTNGALVDGWHRLHAVEAANVSLPFLVVRNVDPDAFTNYDSGKARSVAFRRGVEQERQAVIAAIIRVALYPNGNNRHTVEQSDLTENFAKAELDFMFDNITRAKRPRITNASIRAGMVLAMMANPDKKLPIVNAYNSMIHAEFNNAPRSMSNLYRRLMEDTGLRSVEQAALAWHAFTPSKFNNAKLVVRDLTNDMYDIHDRVLSSLIGAIK